VDSRSRISAASGGVEGKRASRILLREFTALAIDAAARFSDDANSRGRDALHRDLRHDLFLPVLPQSLTVSIVTHRPDFALLERCLRKLALAIGAAREDGVVKSVALALIDNSEDRRIADEVTRLGK
jgi:hypothetical protein